ncbi:MAG: thiamine-phosphate kinase [Dehalococcoidales bacterium]|nr:MAG: thiamine-phosphate kinase [Dehalococcoidales bacterium]
MKVSDIGEFGLIDLLDKMASKAEVRATTAGEELIIGIGDDTAAWRGDTSVQLATVDSLIQDVHFTLDIIPWEELGWRAITANLSDIAAMGGRPRYALVSLALPGDTEVADVTALYKGMIELARQFEVAIIGGDTSRAPLVIINITVLGNNESSHILTRSAARPREKVAVTGHLGASAAGLEMLTKGLQFNPGAMTVLTRAFRQPWPRVVEGQILVEQGVRAAIDISDGLVADLKHICQASRVGARIEIDRVPVRSEVAANFPDRAMELALSGGEDYELLFTASTEVMERVKEAVSCPVTVIGDITAENAGEIVLLDRNGNTVDQVSAGWDHFSRRAS